MDIEKCVIMWIKVIRKTQSEEMISIKADNEGKINPQKDKLM